MWPSLSHSKETVVTMTTPHQWSTTLNHPLDPLASLADAAIFGSELAALADKLQMLERVAAAATQGVAAVSSFQPPARNGSRDAARGPKSAKALEALQKEFDVLEDASLKCFFFSPSRSQDTKISPSKVKRRYGGMRSHSPVTSW